MTQESMVGDPTVGATASGSPFGHDEAMET